MSLGAGIFFQEFSGSYTQAVLQPQDVIRGEDNGGFAAALGKTGDPRIALKFEPAVLGELDGLHHLHVQVNHTTLLQEFSNILKYLIKIFAKRKLLKDWKAPEGKGHFIPHKL
jgi:hypothetical protein